MVLHKASIVLPCRMSQDALWVRFYWTLDYGRDQLQVKLLLLYDSGFLIFFFFTNTVPTTESKCSQFFLHEYRAVPLYMHGIVVVWNITWLVQLAVLQHITWKKMKLSFRKGLHHHYRLQKPCDVSNWLYQRKVLNLKALSQGRWRDSSLNDQGTRGSSGRRMLYKYVSLLRLQNAMNCVSVLAWSNIELVTQATQQAREVVDWLAV